MAGGSERTGAGCVARDQLRDLAHRICDLHHLDRADVFDLLQEPRWNLGPESCAFLRFDLPSDLGDQSSGHSRRHRLLAGATFCDAGRPALVLLLPCPPAVRTACRGVWDRRVYLRVGTALVGYDLLALSG